MRTASGLRLFACVVALFLPLASLGAPVTYGVSSGSITTIQFFDLATGQPSPCPIGGSTNCLAGSVSLTGGSVVVDQATGTLISLSLATTNSGALLMGGFNGYSSVSFSNLSFASGGPSALSGSGGVYNFGPVIGSVTTDLTFNFPAGGPVSVFGASFAAGPTGNLFISPSGQMNLSLTGVNLGVFCDPLTGGCVLAKADFGAIGAVGAIPEPGAVAVFGAGLALVIGALRRRAA